MISLGAHIGDLAPSADPDSNLAWARGCDELHCQFGVLLAPPLTGAISLYAERMAQTHEHAIEFCECRAGQAARRYYEGIVKRRKEEPAAIRDGQMVDEVTWAQRRISQAQDAADSVPTVHGEESEPTASSTGESNAAHSRIPV